MRQKLIIGFFLLIGAAAYGHNERPKYGPNAIPLSQNTHQEYFKTQAAPDFWALIPYYVSQSNDSACSAAALTTTLNAARRDVRYHAEDELVTFHSLVEKYTDDNYKAAVSGDAQEARKAHTRLGVAVAHFSDVIKEAAQKLKIWNQSSKIELITIDPKKKDAGHKRFHELLVKNEMSANDFIILNFTQGVLTGDPEGMVGHIAVVGAYDAQQKSVLILDPDRRWYEPYWSPEDRVYEAIADSRSDAHPGYIYFQVK